MLKCHNFPFPFHRPHLESSSFPGVFIPDFVLSAFLLKRLSRLLTHFLISSNFPFVVELHLLLIAIPLVLFNKSRLMSALGFSFTYIKPLDIFSCLQIHITLQCGANIKKCDTLTSALGIAICFADGHSCSGCGNVVVLFQSGSGVHQIAAPPHLGAVVPGEPVLY